MDKSLLYYLDQPGKVSTLEASEKTASRLGAEHRDGAGSGLDDKSDMWGCSELHWSSFSVALPSVDVHESLLRPTQRTQVVLTLRECHNPPPSYRCSLHGMAGTAVTALVLVSPTPREPSRPSGR